MLLRSPAPHQRDCHNITQGIDLRQPPFLSFFNFFSKVSHHMCNQDDNDPWNAEDPDNECLEEGDLNAYAKQIDDP